MKNCFFSTFLEDNIEKILHSSIMPKVKRKSKAIEEMDLEEFLEDGMSSDDNQDISDKPQQPKKKKHKAEDDDVALDAARHKKFLLSLKKNDPDLHKHLKRYDKDLLEFGNSDDSEGGNQDESDESDDEPTERRQKQTKRNVKVTLEMINQWKTELQKSKPISALKEVMHAFHAAVLQAEGESGQPGSVLKYKVQGGNMFNSVMRLCLQYVVPALDRVLRISNKDGGQDPTKQSKVWGQLKGTVRMYLIDIIKLVSVVNDEAIQAAMLRHVLQLIPYFVVNPKTTKLLLKCLVKFFSTGTEPVRVLGFLCIARMTRVSKDQFLETALKALYLAYVRNCKFTSPSTWPLINFMKRSLIELFALDKELAYQLAFVFIRELAIHLRNALTNKEKDSLKTVYNWQFVHCLHLWADMLSVLHPSPVLQPLIYPLTQVIIGAIKLVPATKYYPLRFQCCRALIHLVQYTDTFIPVLPFLTEVLDQMDFHKKARRQAVKQLDISCALKLSKAQLEESTFKEVILDYTYELIMDFLNTQSHTIAFPELVLPCIILLKKFVKKCKADTFKNPVKQLLAKIEENSKFIVDRRKTITFNISECAAVDNWETSLKTEGTPLSTYYEKYRKMRTEELGRMATSEITLDNSIPMIAKKAKKPKVDQEEKRRAMKEMKEADRHKLPELFDHSDGDSDQDDDVIRFLPPGQKLKMQVEEEYSEEEDKQEPVKEKKKKKKKEKKTPESPEKLVNGKNEKTEKHPSKQKENKIKKNKMAQKDDSEVEEQDDVVEDLLDISSEEEIEENMESADDESDATEGESGSDMSDDGSDVDEEEDDDDEDQESDDDDDDDEEEDDDEDEEEEDDDDSDV